MQLFQVYQPFTFHSHYIDHRGIVVLIAIGIHIVYNGIIYGLDLYRSDLCFAVLAPFVAVELIVIIFLPGIVEHVQVGRILQQVEFCFLYITVQGGADEFATGVLGIFSFGITGFLVTGKAQDGYNW